MKENYFIVHGSFGNPYLNWYENIFNELTLKNKSVYCPQFPIGLELQNYDNWSTLMKYYLDLNIINEDTTLIGHSIGAAFICQFLIVNKIRVKKLIFVCGFNNYFGLNYEYDTVNKTMYSNNIENIHTLCTDITCFYTRNDPYVNYAVEKDFADKVADKHIVIDNGGHLNSESGYNNFDELLKLL